ncbi:AmmeMemoRadiSam system radical SAM enzyme [Halodesulfurarchaeum sp. HSR-GB]|uniref:AmmeMemoRadiSam system radical SAM enzyme n=1 Tax=Halodesulfurarchaeum sp. HSR-GB TaxID=3074077 RepID=UPI00285B058C|nr:AmmeMemoRadiSam system radical SAM enzyme [Halodesulfurarchaeum sp. HSR-GB]MDR5657179.1 AmmeMemoRadiSam system radical SAM enzyme [Halodesulfurarchaeum sp. HSR-GB]
MATPESSTDRELTGVKATLARDREGDTVECTACAHRCVLSPGQRGVCRVRENVDGELRLLTYGLVYDPTPGPPGTLDPIEKKPLYHFHPGTDVLSFGGAACNFRCAFCQNHHLAFADPETIELRAVSPEAAVESALEQGAAGIAWTYNEPTIYAEYVRDGAKAATEAGLYTVMVSNGYFTEEFLAEVGPYLDAINIDVKGFREGPHLEYMGSRLQPTLDSVERVHEQGIHTEVTYLVIPGLNDDPEEIREFAEWVAGIDSSIPVHFSRFHPDFEMQDRPPTPIERLEQAHEIAVESGLEFVYVGNVRNQRFNSTVCPDCGRTWIRRAGFDSTIVADLDGQCECGWPIDVET